MEVDSPDSYGSVRIELEGKSAPTAPDAEAAASVTTVAVGGRVATVDGHTVVNLGAGEVVERPHTITWCSSRSTARASCRAIGWSLWTAVLPTVRIRLSLAVIAGPVAALNAAAFVRAARSVL